MTDSSTAVVALPETQDRLPALPALEVERAKGYARAASATSTRRVYNSDWRHFAGWCTERGAQSLPAAAPTVAVYLGTEADRGLAPPTIGRKLAAIGWTHRQHGHQPPQRSELGIAIVSVMAGIRRSEHVAPTKKTAADADITRDILRAIKGDGLREIRDRAVVGFGMLSAMRRSELVAVRVEDITRQKEGLLVTVRRSKSDQEGKGQVIPIPNGRRIEPVRLLDAWMTAAGIVDGFVFRRVTRCGTRARTEPMSDQAIARLVKLRAAAAGYDADDFAGHSLRAGFLTSAARAGASVFKMREVSRHKSMDVLAGYVRDAHVFTDHAGEDFA